MSDLVDKTLGKYQILTRLGCGGVAEVYQAYQASLDRYVVIKLLHRYLADEIEDIRKSAETLIIFYQFQSRYVEAARTLERAAQRLTSEEQAEPVDRALLTVLNHLGWFYIRLGRLEDAETVIAQCRTIYDRLDIPPVPNHATDPSLALGIIASIRGDYAEAARLGEAARQLSEAHGHRWNRQLAYYLLARAALLQGEYEAARGYAQQAYDITQAVEDRWFEAYCLNELGNVAGVLHDYAAAGN